MPVSLQRISRAQLEQLAVSTVPNDIQLTIAGGALPPAFVAQRALGYLEQGKSEFWCSTFLAFASPTSESLEVVVFAANR